MIIIIIIITIIIYERWFLTYEQPYFVIKTSIKLVGFFIYLFIYFMTLLSNHFYPVLFFAQIIV